MAITPGSAPVRGGTEVTIKGQNFAEGARVMFGGSPAVTARFVDGQTITAVAPAHLPGPTSVYVVMTRAVSSGAFPFSYEGQASDAFEPVLLPIFTPPVQGAFGSNFATDFFAFNLSQRKLDVYGLRSFFCRGFIILPPPFDPRDSPLSIEPRSRASCADRDGKPGRLLWLPAGTSDAFAANLRVFEVSTLPATAGVEIPIVRMHDFRTGTIALLDVPIDIGGFRPLVRIYSLEPEPLTVAVSYFRTTVAVELRPGTDIFDPAYGTIGAFQEPVLVDPPPRAVDILIESTDPTRHIWAFATATNDRTQLITTIAPN